MKIEDKGARMINEQNENQRGVALLTVMIIALIMTILGIAAITISGLETRMSGFVRTKEMISTAAESCEGTAVNIIQQTLYYGMIQPAFLDSATPAGPIPASNSAIVFSEIAGQPLPSPPAPANTIAENYNDSATSTPNLELTNIPGYRVQGDIDRMYKHLKEGQGDLKEIVYRITCVATNVSTGSANTVTSVYKCTVGETCMKQIGT
jgi:Tfp pilus assembly protein PilX